MKKEITKKIFLFFTALIFLISIISFFIPFSNAQENPLVEALKRPIDEFAKSWQTGVWGEGIGKVFLGLLILFLIWGLFDSTGIIKNGWISFFIALTIAFLSTAYLLPSEIVSLMQTYSALGLTLGVFIPFFIMVLFTYGAVKSGDGFQRIIQRFIWFVFFVFIIYRLYISLSSASGVVSIVIALVALASFIASFFNKKVTDVINKEMIEAMKERTREFQARVKATEEGRATASQGG